MKSWNEIPSRDVIEETMAALRADGMRRLGERVVPLESERARKAYGLPPTF